MGVKPTRQSRKIKLLYIVASMDAELDGLRTELDARPPEPGFPVEFHCLGVGPRRAGDAMTAALDGAGIRPAVLLLGVAGAIAPGMGTGQLLLAENYLSDVDGGEPIAPDPAMLTVAEAAAAEARMPAHRGASLTVDHLICEERERRQLREKYGAASVNMEDSAVAAAARRADAPFISVRVVLDTYEQRLPGYLPGLARGRGAILTQVVAQPWRIPTLRRLKAQMELCQAVLTRFGMAYLRQEAIRRQGDRERASREALY